MCFPVNFAKFLRTPILSENPQWLLLLLRFLSSLLCCQENIQTNIKGKTFKSSRYQMFFKIAVLKNFTITVKKHLCWNVFLIKFQADRPAFLFKKRLKHSCFLKKSLRTAFFVEHIKVCYTFSKFYVMIEFLDVFGYKIDIFHISCTIALISSMDHGYSVLVFTPKFLVSVTFACITTSAPELF